MNDPELNDLTCTEPNTLEEETKSQKELESSTNRFKKLIKLKNSSQIVGDIDLFFLEDEEVEVNIMIANEAFRKQGIATEALKLSLSYIINRFNDDNIAFIAKISSSNIESLSFFKKHSFTTSQTTPDYWGNFCLSLPSSKVLPLADLKVENKIKLY